MAYESLELLQQLGGDIPDATGTALATAFWQSAAEDVRAERETEAKRAAAADRAETMAIQNRAMGDPLGQVQRAQADIAGLRDEEAELLGKLQKVRGKLDSARSAVEFWSDRVLVVEEQSARARVPDAVELAQLRMADELRRVHESRDVLQRARRRVRHGR